MAIPEHLEVARRGAQAIMEWGAANPSKRLDLSKAQLTKAHLNGARLVEADLRLAKLIGGTLIGADLSGADLSQANLSGANLRGADLGNATLRAANLRLANLNWANLSGANLTQANLTGATLVGTNLIQSAMPEARVGLTTFGLLDLSETSGLREVVHVLPSTFGMDTLARSGERIPDAFLRGCGLSEWEIQFTKLHDPDLDATKINTFGSRLIDLRSKSVDLSFFSAFISYSHEDKEFARALHDALQDRGVRCWLDEHQIKPGDKIMRRVDEGIRLWDKVLLCCSKASLTSWWVDKEIGMAYSKEERLWKDRGAETLSLIPLNLDGHLFEWEHPRAHEIRERMAPDFTGCPEDEPKFTAGVDQLVGALREAREPPPEAKL